MASSFEKSVKGATKIKAAPPKTKYIEHILIATHSGEHGVAEVFRSLQNRLRDSTWTVVFKSLITVHFMIREGSLGVTLDFLSKHRNMLAISNFSDVQTQGRNIRHYSDYLSERAKAYRDTKIDFVRGGENKMEKMPVDKGLLRATEVLQEQIAALLKCDVLDNEPENEITITVFRMLVLDLLQLFHVVNQAMINILGHFFEMSRPDAERALGIYFDFTKQTESVVSYLSTARQYQHQTRVEVPKLKHAPTNLGKQLEDYLSDPDFEINRRQYLAEQDAKKGKTGSNGINVKKSPSNPKSDGESRVAAGKAFPDATSSRPPTSKPVQQAKGPDPDLIDFFDSIEQNQQPMATQPTSQQQITVPNFATGPQFQVPPQQQFQQNGFVTQPNHFQTPDQFQQQPSHSTFIQQQQLPQAQGIQGQQVPILQPNFTAAGFGGYTPQPNFSSTSLSPIPQDNVASFQNQSAQPFGTANMGQPQSNPFRQSMMTSNQTGIQAPSFLAPSSTSSPIIPQSTNPFKSIATQQTQAFAQQPQQPQPQQQFPQSQQGSFASPPLQSTSTGTNPFARNTNLQTTQPPPAASSLMPQQTGSTNPFRQSQFVNTTTGTGWQHGQQPIGGGLDQLETVPVFPRPAQQQPWQQ